MNTATHAVDKEGLKVTGHDTAFDNCREIFFPIILFFKDVILM